MAVMKVEEYSDVRLRRGSFYIGRYIQYDVSRYNYDGNGQYNTSSENFIDAKQWKIEESDICGNAELLALWRLERPLTRAEMTQINEYYTAHTRPQI